jgi:DUF4097 and DUF4098 domain-containing protein YvlB
LNFAKRFWIELLENRKMIGSKVFAPMGILWLVCTGCSFAGPKVWVEQTQEIRFDTSGMVTLETRTHNGDINFEAAPAGQTEAIVTVTTKAGGETQAEADEAMQALKVFSERAADGIHKLGWKWKVAKRSNWQAQVSFAISAPEKLNFDAQTHNGAITAQRIAGDVDAVTHNGAIELTAQGGTLNAKTHNGKIDVSYAGSDLKLLTHNGEVVADLGGCEAVSGSIESHNGGIQILVGEKTSANLSCRTNNGSVNCDAPLKDIKASRRKLTGTLGVGGGTLAVGTHNGSVRIKKAG